MIKHQTLDNIVKSEDLFKSLSEEKQIDKDKSLDIKKDKKLESLLNAFDKIIDYKEINWESYYKYSSTVLHNYIYIIRTNSDKNYNSDDLNKFLILSNKYSSKEYFPHKLGIYLSALINFSNKSCFTLNLKHSTEKIESLGYRNLNKKIIINGDVGKRLGFFMQNGEIILNGNAGDYTGYFMKKGKIYIHGNCGINTGEYADGGEMHIDGNFSCQINHSKITIYKNGKLKVKKGRIGIFKWLPF